MKDMAHAYRTSALPSKQDREKLAILQTLEEVDGSHRWTITVHSSNPLRFHVKCPECKAHFLSPWEWDGSLNERLGRVRERAARYSTCEERLIREVYEA